MKKNIMMFGIAAILMAAGTLYAISSRNNNACLCGSANCVCTTACCVPDSKCCEKGGCSEACCDDNCCGAACCK